MLYVFLQSYMEYHILVVLHLAKNLMFYYIYQIAMRHRLLDVTQITIRSFLLGLTIPAMSFNPSSP